MANVIESIGDRASTAAMRRGRLCWIGFTTFIVRAYQDIVSNFIFTIAPPAVATALYFIVFGTLIGRRIGNIDGLQYEQYLVPGLIVLPIITGAYGQAGLSLVVAKMYRQIDEHLVSPQPSWMIVVSYVAGGLLRGMIVGLAAGIVTLLFTRTHVQHLFMSIGALLLVSLISSLTGFINGLVAKTLEQVNWVPSFVLTPLIYFGGVFYSLSLLPAWAQKLSLANPIFYMVNLIRYSVCGISDVDLRIPVLLMLLAPVAMLGVAATLVDRGVGISE